ncbi:hypothetical protein L6472_06060 [Prevotella sp. E13-17]|uniref:DUF7841 family protein n=1 Tax=Prevotella sp. E13-17 TaxID=2913616 RepID=UPI001EDBF506|nr:hypothetical protein [Prevotella sp. E13-17]UKK52142.1 hypothetical protein L6472_06060 [Prevotella sp. E13-17]
MEDLFDDELDLVPEGYREYKRKHGRHFSEGLADFAVGRMKGEDGNEITPMTKEDVDKLLLEFGVEVKHAKEHDTVFVANMGLADYLGESVPDLEHLAKYIKNVIDDPDGYEGIAFARWLMDVCVMRVEVPWDEVM